MTESRLRRLSALALSSALLLGGAVAPALAQTPARKSGPTSLAAKASTLATELRTAYHKLDVLDEAYNQATAKVAHLRRVLSADTAAIAVSERRLSSDILRLRTVAINAYVTGDTSTGLAVLLESSRSQLPERQAYLAAAAGALDDSVSTVKADHSRLSERRAALVVQERAASAAARQIGRDRAEARRTTASLEAALSQVKGNLVGARDGAGACRQCRSRPAGSAGGSARSGPGRRRAPRWRRKRRGRPCRTGGRVPARRALRLGWGHPRSRL